MNNGLIRGIGPGLDGFTTGPTGAINSATSRITTGELRIGEANTNRQSLMETGANKLTTVNPLTPHTSPYFPGDIGALVVAGNGNYQNQGSQFSSLFHTGGVYYYGSQGGGGWASFESNIIAKNVPGIASTIGRQGFVTQGNLFRADGAVMTMASVLDYESITGYDVVNGGTMAITQRSNFEANVGSIGPGVTVTNETAYRVIEGSGGGTITTRQGLDIPVLTKGTTNNLIRLVGANATVTANPGDLISVLPATYTANFASAQFPTILNSQGTGVLQQSAGGFLMHTVFANSMTYKNIAATAANFGPIVTYQAQYVLQADTQTITGGSHTDFFSNPTSSVINAGVMSGVSHAAFKSQAVVGTGTTWTSRTGFTFAEATGSGTLTTQIGIDIVALAKGTTNIGIRNLASLLQQGALVYTPTTVTVTTNAGTVPVTASNAKFTNSSAATMTITLATSGASDGQVLTVRVFDFSAAAQTITWVNTENGEGTPPATSNGSTTLPKTPMFMYNSATSKWRCIKT